VAALVDEAALRVVLGLFGPGADEVVVHRRAAGGTTIGCLPFHELEHVGDGHQLAAADRVAHRLVAVVGAAAHGLGLGRGAVVATGGEHDDLLHQPGARATARAGFCVLAYLVQREQALVLDGLADGALGHAVAAADLVAVLHRSSLALALVAGVAQVRFAKHQLVADVAHAAAVAQQLEVPAAVHRVAIQAGAHQLVVLDDELFVHATEGVAHHDLLGVVSSLKVSGREQVDARHLELGGRERALIATDAEFRQMVGQHLALLEQRGHQAIGNAPVCGAFAHGVDARVGGGLQRVAHDNAAVHMQAHLFGQSRVGADAHGHHHQIGGHLGAVLELDAGHAAFGVAHQFLGLRTHQEAHATVFQRLLQHLARHVIQLALHQRGHHVHHAHGHSALHEAVRGLQTQQAAANDDGVLVGGGGVDHGLRVGNVAVGQHTLQVFAGDGQDEGVGARGEDEAVVFGADHRAVAAGGADHAAHAVHIGHGEAGVQRDVVVGVPGPVVQDDLVDGLLARQHGGQQNAVVVGVGLGTEHRDVIQIGGDLEQLFQRAHTGHAVSHHHQFELFHHDSIGSIAGAMRKTKKASTRCCFEVSKPHVGTPSSVQLLRAPLHC